MKIDLEKVRISFQKFVIENRLPSCVIVVANSDHCLATLPGSFGSNEDKRFAMFLQDFIDAFIASVDKSVKAKIFADRALASLNKG